MATKRKTSVAETSEDVVTETVAEPTPEPVIELVKEVPPPITGRGRRKHGRWAKIAELLKAEPGEWFRVATGVKGRSVANALGEGFESKSRSNGDGTVNVWARYVGVQEQAEQAETVEPEFDDSDDIFED